MSKPAPQLASQRAARDRARADFQRRLGVARVDLAPEVLKRRALAEAQRTSLAVAHQAIDIANDSRGVVAATVAAIVLWFTRKPITAGARRLIYRLRTRKTLSRKIGDRVKLVSDNYWRRFKEYAND